MSTTPTQTPAEQAETAKAIELHRQLAAVNPLDLPIMSRDRCVARKEQARLARELFKQLGFRGISVTTPNYSMAQTVSVRLPRRNDYERDGQGFMVPGCDAAVANSQARERILAILQAAFPNHDDRSDSQTDYFDCCWSV